MTDTHFLLTPEWPAPPTVRAYTTLCGRNADFDLLKTANRQQLKTLLSLPKEPAWLKQTHSKTVVRAYTDCDADASYTDSPGEVCVIMTADCLPVLLYDLKAQKIAAIHAGWRGLAAGILQETLRAGGFSGPDTLAWLGPAIGPQQFEVGPEVRDLFLAHWPHCTDAFYASSQGRFLANIYTIATHQLALLGVSRISGGHHCTFSEKNLFFSYRRNKETGRMASLIWMEPAFTGNIEGFMNKSGD